MSLFSDHLLITIYDHDHYTTIRMISKTVLLLPKKERQAKFEENCNCKTQH